MILQTGPENINGGRVAGITWAWSSGSREMSVKPLTYMTCVTLQDSMMQLVQSLRGPPVSYINEYVSYCDRCCSLTVTNLKNEWS